MQVLAIQMDIEQWYLGAGSTRLSETNHSCVYIMEIWREKSILTFFITFFFN